MLAGHYTCFFGLGHPALVFRTRRDYPSRGTMQIQEHVPLAPHTTIGLGGPARYLAECRSEADVREALAFATERGLPLQVLGGGSNVIVADHGFDGLVAHVTLGGIAFQDDGAHTTLTMGAGVAWDDAVARAVARGLSGIECLSGIPGTAGATPIQNVGAYGQEIADTLLSVSCLDREDATPVTFERAACDFGYRTSRFKSVDRDRFVVLGVQLQLAREARPELRYPELAAAVKQRSRYDKLSPKEAIARVRDVVLELRRGKSMVLDDPSDPNRRSVGSFFLNPVLKDAALADLNRRWQEAGHADALPTFPAERGTKVPAAWLVEHAGYPKGFQRDGVGISTHHSLALVNLGDGTTAELLGLAEEIRAAVADRFGITLEREPVAIG